MTRRPVLPGASELFRRTDNPQSEATAPVTELPTLTAAASSPSLRGKGRAGEDTAQQLSLVPAVADDELAGLRDAAPPVAVRRDPPRRGRPTTERPKHDEKITVYCSADELVALEQARLTLRSEHGVVADRGRIVRTAVEVLIADLVAHGEDSVLARRLRTR